MVIIKNIIIKIILLLLFSETVSATKVLDFETENFIEKINSKILSVNNYNKKVHFSIILDDEPNAFVNEENKIFINSLKEII